MRLLMLGTVLLFGVVAPRAEGQSRNHDAEGSVLDGVHVTGQENPGLKSFDQLMTGFLKEQSVPGASLAVSRQGRVVYARGFGFANVEKSKPVFPTTRFRIASISKPITAVAILSLVQAGKLDLDDKFVTFMKPGQRAKARAEIRSITIRHLLHHRGGWDRDVSFDPMFKTVMIGKELGLAEPANQRQIIDYMLTRPLDFKPGERYAYSNFGYCLLGRVIEKISKTSYREFVQQMVLQPLGIHAIDLANTLTTAKGESRYYTGTNELVNGVVPGVVGKKVPRQYGGWSIENMDSHGGWIASAPDLVTFAAALDKPVQVDFLRDDLVTTMFSPFAGDERKDVFYGLGWQIRRLRSPGKINAWHTGSLPGTSTILVRRHDGLNWAVLFNSRDGKDGKRLSAIIDPLVHSAANKVTNWPEKAISLD